MNSENCFLEEFLVELEWARYVGQVWLASRMPISDGIVMNVR